MADLVTRLTLSTQNFDRNINKSQKQIQEFQQRINTFSTAAISSFTKFAGGIGIALTASEAFEKGIRSCQTTSDMMDNNLNAAKDSVDAFFRSLVTGDWNVFNEGILGAFNNLKDLSMIMDELADKKLSLSYIKAEDLRDLERFEQLAKDTNRTYQERIDAAQNMSGVITHLSKSIKETNDLDIKALNTDYAAKSGLKIDRGDLDYFFKNTNFSGELTTAANNAYKEYIRLQQEAQKKYAANRQDVNTYGFNPTRRYQSEYADAIQALEIYKQQNDFLIKQGWLTEETDDKRKQTVERLKEQLNAEKEIYSLQKRVDETRRSVTTSNKVNTISSTTTTTNTITEGSIAQMEKQIADLKKQYQNAANDGTRAGIMVAIKEAETQLRMLQLRASKMDLLTPSKIDPTAKNQHKQNSMPLINVSTKELDKFRNIQPVKLIDTDASALDYITTMASLVGNISGATSNATASWLTYSANIISSIGAMLPAMASLFGLTAALGVAEQSKLVFPLNLVAMAATTAGLIAAIASIPKFAEGGIFVGNNTIGDMNLARVNAGEMILNNRQQRNLFNLLNGSGSANSYNTNREVKLRIEGRDLVGVLANQYNKTSKYK